MIDPCVDETTVFGDKKYNEARDYFKANDNTNTTTM